MNATSVDKMRSYSQTKRASKLLASVSPKLPGKNGEKSKFGNKPQEIFPALDFQINEQTVKIPNKPRLPQTQKSDIVPINNSIFANPSYKTEMNSTMHPQILGLFGFSEPEPNLSFTEILRIKQVNFVQMDKRIAKPIEKPIQPVRKAHNRREKKKNSGLDESFDRTIEDREQNATDRVASARNSVSLIKQPRLGSCIFPQQRISDPIHITNEDQTIEHEQTDKRSIIMQEKERHQRSESSDSSPDRRISRRNGEEMQTKKNMMTSPVKQLEGNYKLRTQNSNMKLGPLDSIKEVVPKRMVNTATNSFVKTNSNLISAHKASAVSQNYVNFAASPYSLQMRTHQSFHPGENSNPVLVPNHHNKQSIEGMISNNRDLRKRNDPIQNPSYVGQSIRNNSSQNNLTSSRNLSPQVNKTLTKSAFPVVVSNSSVNNSNLPTVTPNSKVGVGVNNSTVFNFSSTSGNVSTVSTRPSNSQVSNYTNNQQIAELKKKTIYIPPPVSNKYKYYIGGGNNAELVERIMTKRDWWEKTESFNTLFNFKWQQGQRGYKYERLTGNTHPKQLVNHFEFHREITTKNLLIKNLSNYCEQNKINLFDLTPTTFLFDMDDEVNFDTEMQRFAKFFIKNDPNPKRYNIPDGDRKNNNIWYNFDYRKKRFYHPPVLSNGKKPSSFLKPKLHSTFVKGVNAWVLKPTGFNRGIGIEVFNSLEALNDFLNKFLDGEQQPKTKKAKKEEGDSGSESEDEDKKKKFVGPVVKSHTFVIQKYIEDLLLIKQRKFDIRVWVLVTHDMQLYFFKEGYLRMSSDEFSLTSDNIDNKFIHLTNNAVQKYSENYGQFENGNQLNFNDFDRFCKGNNLDIDVRGKVIPRMKELVQISMLSVKKGLDPFERKYNFEIFGYDFMVDTQGDVWLIEVNTNPCIEEASPILEKYLPRMLDDGFKLTLDVLFPPLRKPNLLPALKPPVLQKPEIPIVNEPKQEEKTVVPELKENEKKIETNKEGEAAAESTQKEGPKEENESVTSHSIEAEEVEKLKAASKPPSKIEGYSDDENMWQEKSPKKIGKYQVPALNKN